jgi:hypothetical protein
VVTPSGGGRGGVTASGGGAVAPNLVGSGRDLPLLSDRHRRVGTGSHAMRGQEGQRIATWGSGRCASIGGESNNEKCRHLVN